MSTLGRKTPSLGGSRFSVYSHGSTVRTLRGGTSRKSGVKPAPLPWYKKPLLQYAFYTDLQRGSWHIGFYTLFLSVWTLFTTGFDLYCIHEAAPGSSHTGYYIFSFDFVYVGNPHVRNLLVVTHVFSLLGAFALLVTSVMLLDALRKEQETAFKGWLYVMAFFTPWRIISWVYAAIVNDMIFSYNIVMFIAWLVFNILNLLSCVCIFSLYLELNDLTKLQDLARLKMDTMSSLPASRAASTFGSRPTSPYVNRDTMRREKEQHEDFRMQNQPIYTTRNQNQPEPQYGYSQY